MRRPSALTVWRVLALGSMLGCGYLWWSRPTAPVPNTEGETDSERPREHVTRSIAQPAALSDADLTQLNRALAQALTSEA